MYDYLNAELDFPFTSAKTVNLELNFDPVLISSGSTFGSETHVALMHARQQADGR